MALTATQIKNAKPEPKDRKLFDGKGLFLLVTTKGHRRWRLKYRHNGREKLLALGVYPEITLAEAREAAQEARSHIAKGTDPMALRSAEKGAQKALNGNTFEAVGREWFAKQLKRWKGDHPRKIERRLEQHVYPYIGGTPVAEVHAMDVKRLLDLVEGRGHHETTHRVRQYCSQIFRYAVATGRADNDPAGALSGTLDPIPRQNFAAITDPAKVGALLRAIDGYDGQATTRAALRLAPLVFVRPGELRQAEWSEFDLDAAEWIIPGDKMKGGLDHLVSLSRQAVAILRELEPLTGHGRYLFPGLRSWARPMSNNTLNAALRRLGYSSGEMTAHGFRSMASTLLNEQGTWNPDAIERQLAHVDGNSVRKAYNRAEHIEERRRMMQAWADHLCRLRGEVAT